MRRCKAIACRVPEFGVQLNSLLTGTTGTLRSAVFAFLVRQESNASTDMRFLTTGMRSEKCVVVRTCTYTNLDSTVPRLSGIGYLFINICYKLVQHVTVLNTVGSCNTLVL